MKTSTEVNYYNRNPFKPIECHFASLLMNQKFSDFVLFFPNASDPKYSRIPIHRFIFDARSTYFHKMFTENPSSSSITVCFPQWCLGSVVDVLTYFYTSKEVEINDNNISAIVFIAKSWGCPPLLSHSFDYIMNELKPEYSLDALIKLSDSLDNNEQSIKHLVDMVSKNIAIFDPKEMARLRFDLFFEITQHLYKSRPDERVTTALCNSIEEYVEENIFKLGKTEFEALSQRFSMKVPHNGIITLLEYAIKFQWGIDICREKVLHSWRYLDQERLAKLPIFFLTDLLEENYINTKSEDDIFDFITLVSRYQPDKDILGLWVALRVPWLSVECKKKIKDSQLPQSIKDEIECPKSGFETRRIPREGTKALILGSADDASLKDVLQFMCFCGFKNENLMAVRADRELDPSIDFSDFNVIIVFGFYKFYNSHELSKRLSAFVKDGGGLVMAFSAHKSEEFGLGDPILSMLPINVFTKGFDNTPKYENDGEAVQSVGCKHMRLLFDVKEGAEVVLRWNDGIPFIVLQDITEKSGGIVVINATPVTSDIIPKQWAKDDKTMASIFTDAIVSVANMCFSKIKRSFC